MAADETSPDLPDPGPRQVGRARRFAWLAMGWIWFAIGAIGIVVPGLPTTGPMLLALACFARGSTRMHQWLLTHPVFGPPIQSWRKYGIISIRAKVVAVAMMCGSLAYIAWLSPVPQWAVVVIGCLIAIGIVVVVRLPHAVTQDRSLAEPDDGEGDAGSADRGRGSTGACGTDHGG